MVDNALKRTPLYKLHRELGAKLVPFAGYEMPVQYPLGVLKEHLHTRSRAGLFDVSHMGQILLYGSDAAKALERLVPVDIVDLPVGMQRYAIFTNHSGGILDDLMVANYGHYLMLVVNAACKVQDLAHLRTEIGHLCEIKALFESRALIALQGPQAAQVLQRFNSCSTELKFMGVAQMELYGVRCYVSRSGYTGEDGYEISAPSEHAEALARKLLAEPEVEPIGLGARDSLRLEAGLCLYGHDMDQHTTPIEAGLAWAISKARRADGTRAGGFIGSDLILAQQAVGATRKRVGFIPLERVPVREGVAIHDATGVLIGHVTSGGFGPTLDGPLAMGYIEGTYAAIGAEVFAEVRNRRIPMRVVKTPFVEQRYYRG